MSADGLFSPRAARGREPPPPGDDGAGDLGGDWPVGEEEEAGDSFAVLAADPFEQAATARRGQGGRRGRSAAPEPPADPAPARAAGTDTSGSRRGERRAANPVQEPRPRPEALALAAERPPSNAALIGRLLTALVLLGLSIAGGVVALQWEPRLLPIRTVVVNGEMHGLSRQALQEAIAAHISGGILTQSLTELKLQVEGLPWIDRVSLRRVWPDRIEVRVSEHEAHARWGDNGLVTAEGVVFRPRDGRVPAGLALLQAPDDAMAPEVVRRFQDWGGRLASVGLILEGVRRDARGDWTLRLLGGTEVLLGTRDLEARLARLLAAWPQVEAIGVPARLDLRYSNGLAVRWLPIVNSGAIERVATNPDRQRS